MVALWGTCFHLWSTWGGGWIKLCGKHDKIACGQCGEVVKCNLEENMFYTCGPCGEVARWIFLENMV